MLRARLRLYFRDFGYRVIRLKYFIMVVCALILEIATLTLYLLKLQDIVEFELFSLAILYGIISAIIIVLSLGIILLMKLDSKRDSNKIKKFLDFQRKYRILANKYLNEINSLMIRFDTEKEDIDKKIEYASVLENKYDGYQKEFSKIDVPEFLSYAHSCENGHLLKEKQFYGGFSSLTNPDDLKKLGIESETGHACFLRELNSIEKKLKLIV
jgi:hypothetical protein